MAAGKSLQSCPTLRPQRRQPTRRPRPWDSPGKNTGVGCHFLLQCMKVKSESEVTHSFRVRPLATPWTAAFQAPPSMGFSRQEYWSGVPLPSPFWALRVIICSNQLGIDLWPHVSGYLEEVGTYFSVVHTVFYYRSSLHAAHKPHCNVLHRHSIEFFCSQW